jgi:PAS domain S-box-containing protein
VKPGPSAEFMSAIVQHVAHPIFVKDRDFRFVVINRAFVELLGHEPDNVIGKTDYDFFPEEEADFFRRKDVEMFSSEAVVKIEEEPITDVNGDLHILATTKVPYRNGDGEVTHLIGIIKDITLLKRAETALSEKQFVAMFEKTVGTNVWPDVDFRPTATTCSTGKPKFFTAADGVPLARAVASSCAIPGYFPAVSHAGEHYMDGGRGPQYHTAIVAELGLDAALFIGPKIAVPRVSEMLLEDMDAVAATGVRVHTILGSERLDALGVNLMDYSKRPAAFECGLADGAEHAPAVKELLAVKRF